MRHHLTTALRSMTVPPGVAFILIMPMVLAMGAEPSRVDDRDREVLEAALKDIVNPENPLYQSKDRNDDTPPPRALTIVLDRLTGGDRDADVFKDHKVIAKELVTFWRRRNAGQPMPLKKLGLQDKRFIEVDFDELDQQAQKMNKLFWELFWEKYPDSVGYGTVSLPGYSRGGSVAVVEIHVGRDSYHPSIWIFLMTKVDGRWIVGWRDREIW